MEHFARRYYTTFRGAIPRLSSVGYVILQVHPVPYVNTQLAAVLRTRKPARTIEFSALPVPKAKALSARILRRAEYSLKASRKNQGRGTRRTAARRFGTMPTAPPRTLVIAVVQIKHRLFQRSYSFLRASKNDAGGSTWREAARVSPRCDNHSGPCTLKSEQRS